MDAEKIRNELLAKIYNRLEKISNSLDVVVAILVDLNTNIHMEIDIEAQKKQEAE